MNIINYDQQGWPIEKKSLRDILEIICNKENGNYVISESDPALDIFPLIVEDDGMGYGINEKFISSISFQPKETEKIGKAFCTIFIDEEIENIDLWEKACYKPYQIVFLKDKTELILEKIRLTDSKEIEYGGKIYNPEKRIIEDKVVWFKENELSR